MTAPRKARAYTPLYTPRARGPVPVCAALSEEIFYLLDRHARKQDIPRAHLAEQLISRALRDLDRQAAA